MGTHLFHLLRAAGKWICFALVLGVASGVYALDWPTRPIKLLVPYPAGGSTDILTRLLAHGLSEPLGQPVVVENRGGANGSLGTSSFAKAGFDDHYFLISNQSTLSINQYLYKSKIGYDPVADLVPVGRYVQTTNVIVVTRRFRRVR
jgi:tripartite-type tricarboxylate transporter receptor subunit TctC